MKKKIIKSISEIPFFPSMSYLVNYLQGNGKIRLGKGFGSLKSKAKNQIIDELFKMSNSGEIKISNSKIKLSLDKNQTEKDIISIKPYKNLNKEQTLPVISPEKNITVIAGAGSGKTKVIEYRVKYLIEEKKEKPSDILVITFTRNARDELKKRIKSNVNIETFNSYSQKILDKYGLKLDIIPFNELSKIIKKILGDKLSSTIYRYNNKSIHEGLYQLTKDLIQYIEISKTDKCYINNNQAQILKDLARQINTHTYTDQVIMASKLPHKKFKHVLIDEFQDINDLQLSLIEKINPDYFFKVGDPRQSIYGWRGSKIQHIIQDKGKKYYLKKNYRSGDEIVRLANQVILPMNLPAQITNKKSKVELLRVSSEKEIVNICKFHKDHEVICRTNTLVEKIGRGQTVHSVKGLEFDKVIVAFADDRFFPCKVPSHPVFDNLLIYDKFSEERRLLYVALTRAKENLKIVYMTPSRFLKI